MAAHLFPAGVEFVLVCTICSNTQCFFDLAAHAEYFDQPGLLVNAQHLALLRGPMTEDTEKGLYLLLEQAEDKRLGKGEAGLSGEQFLLAGEG